MGTYYLKESENLNELKQVKIVTDQLDIVFYDQGKHKLIYAKQELDILPKQYEDIKYEDKQLNKVEILGYIDISTKRDKTTSVKADDCVAQIDEKYAVKKKSSGKLVGYLLVTDENGVTYYVGLCKKSFILVPIFIGIALAVLFLLFMFNFRTTPTPTPNNTPKVEDTKPVFKEGDKGTGELDVDDIDFGEQLMFRMRLNCTPMVTDDVMNIRIESPAEENANYGFVVKVYALQKIDGDEIIEEYEEEGKLIYESPQIFANENIGECELDTPLESGVYIGRAVYDVYDLDNNLLGKTAAKLTINVQ